MDLSGVHLTLDDVQDRDVAMISMAISWSGHHDILRLCGHVDTHELHMYMYMWMHIVIIIAMYHTVGNSARNYH